MSENRGHSRGKWLRGCRRKGQRWQDRAQEVRGEKRNEKDRFVEEWRLREWVRVWLMVNKSRKDGE